MKGMDMVNADLVQVPSQIALGELLPEVNGWPKLPFCADFDR